MQRHTRSDTVCVRSYSSPNILDCLAYLCYVYCEVDTRWTRNKGGPDARHGRAIHHEVGRAVLADPVGPATLSLIHISEPTRRTPISYAVFCLKKKKKKT